jgi:protein-S-isoprenylcysteine O-methyltransferase Ste14
MGQKVQRRIPYSFSVDHPLDWLPIRNYCGLENVIADAIGGRCGYWRSTGRGRISDEKCDDLCRTKTQTRTRARIAAMTIYGRLIFALWLTLVMYWALSGRGVKRNISGGWISRREIGLRLGLLVLVLLALRISVVGRALSNARLYALNTSMLMGLIGFVFCLLGIGLAILARAYLGRNWGMPMSRKENPELVTTGPYAFVRHPIYTGVLLAMLGSAIGQSIFWLLPLILYGAYFIHSARREEKLLTEQFPEHYRAYMKRTKMLLPFVL